MTDQTEPQPELNSSRKKFLAMVAIAFVPIFVAYSVFFYFPDLMPTGTTNHGNLIRPPLQTEVATETWTLLILVDNQCDDVCEQVLYETRQIHIALGKEAPRITRQLIAERPVSTEFSGYLLEEHKQAAVTVDVELYKMLRQLDPAANTAFLRDPFGNILMYYRADQGGKPMLQDIKHQLRISNIG